jgi:hypothetical protein
LDAVSGQFRAESVSVDTAVNTQQEEAKVVLMRSTVLEVLPESKIGRKA